MSESMQNKHAVLKPKHGPENKGRCDVIVLPQIIAESATGDFMKKVLSATYVY